MNFPEKCLGVFLLNLIKTFFKSTHLFWKLLKTFLFLTLLLYSIGITAFSGFASMIGAGLSLFGITTASAQLTADLVETKAARTKAIGELMESKAKEKKLTKELSSLKLSQKKLATEAADLRATRKAVSEAAQSAANRSVRLIKSNLASEGLDWIPIVGIAAGAGAVIYEIKEICGQLDDMDKISRALGDEPADRGELGYLCSGEKEGIVYKGKFFKKLNESETWPKKIYNLYAEYDRLLTSGGFFDDFPILDGVSLSHSDEPSYIIYETEKFILIEHFGFFSSDFYLNQKE